MVEVKPWSRPIMLLSELTLLMKERATAAAGCIQKCLDTLCLPHPAKRQ